MRPSFSEGGFSGGGSFSVGEVDQLGKAYRVARPVPDPIFLNVWQLVDRLLTG